MAANMKNLWCCLAVLITGALVNSGNSATFESQSSVAQKSNTTSSWSDCIKDSQVVNKDGSNITVIFECFSDALENKVYRCTCLGQEQFTEVNYKLIKADAPEDDKGVCSGTVNVTPPTQFTCKGSDFTDYRICLSLSAFNMSSCYEPFRTDPGEPSPVEEFNAISRSATQTSVLFTWKKPSQPNGPLDGYRLTYKTRQIFLTSEETSYTLTGLDPRDTIEAAISAFNNVTNSMKFSNDVKTVAKTLDCRPSEPRDIRVHMTTESLQISWKTPEITNGQSSSTVDGYRVVVKGGGLTLINNVTNLNYLFTGLSSGTNYDVSVQAFNIFGETDCTSAPAKFLAATKKRNVGTIVGIIFGVIGVVAVGAVGGYLGYRRYQKKRPTDDEIAPFNITG